MTRIATDPAAALRDRRDGVQRAHSYLAHCAWRRDERAWRLGRQVVEGLLMVALCAATVVALGALS